MKYALKLEVRIKQKSNYPKTLPFDIITNKILKYGVFENGHFLIDQKGKEGFICFHSSHIGRGINVHWNEEEKDEIQLVLLLPSTDEEIHDFIEIGLRIAKYWTCSITLNNTLVTSQELSNMEEDIEMMNSKILQDVVKSLMSDNKAIIDLPCAVNTLSISKQEVLPMKDVSNTNLYRDWLHDIQINLSLIVAEEVLERDGKRFGLLTIPLQVRFLIVKKPSLKYENQVEEWIVQFYDVVQKEVFGYLTYEDFMRQIDDFQYEDYDARYWLMKPINADTAKYLVASTQND